MIIPDVHKETILSALRNHREMATMVSCLPDDAPEVAAIDKAIAALEAPALPEHAPNWSHAPLWANYWTRDERGNLIWWESEPYRHREIGIWMDESDGKRTQATCQAILRQRPAAQD